MATIQNKMESIKFIYDNNLNCFNERKFNSGDIFGVEEFIKEFPVKYYYMRELIAATENVYYALNKDEVLSKVNDYENFGLAVSSHNYIDNVKLVGEITYYKNNDFLFSGSTNKYSTHRDFLEPNYFFNTDIFDERIKYIPYIDEMIEYIYIHGLFDMTIEFVVFDKPVGKCNEKVVIYEIRTHY